MKGSQIEELALLFGGVPKLARRLGVGVTALYNWRTRGIPDQQKWRLLRVAEEDGVELPAWFRKQDAA